MESKPIGDPFDDDPLDLEEIIPRGKWVIDAPSEVVRRFFWTEMWLDHREKVKVFLARLIRITGTLIEMYWEEIASSVLLFVLINIGHAASEYFVEDEKVKADINSLKDQAYIIILYLLIGGFVAKLIIFYLLDIIERWRKRNDV
jgi:hypothetical protein